MKRAQGGGAEARVKPPSPEELLFRIKRIAKRFVERFSETEVGRVF